jgi:hypothetical protein
VALNAPPPLFACLYPIIPVCFNANARGRGLSFLGKIEVKRGLRKPKKERRRKRKKVTNGI